PLRQRAGLQEPVIRLDLRGQQVGHVEHDGPLGKALADALFLGERVGGSGGHEHSVSCSDKWGRNSCAQRGMPAGGQPACRELRARDAKTRSRRPRRAGGFRASRKQGVQAVRCSVSYYFNSTLAPASWSCLSSASAWALLMPSLTALG